MASDAVLVKQHPFFIHSHKNTFGTVRKIEHQLFCSARFSQYLRRDGAAFHYSAQIPQQPVIIRCIGHGGASLQQKAGKSYQQHGQDPQTDDDLHQGKACLRRAQPLLIHLTALLHSRLTAKYNPQAPYRQSPTALFDHRLPFRRLYRCHRRFLGRLCRAQEPSSLDGCLWVL